MHLLTRRCQLCGARLGAFERECSACRSGTTQLSRWQPRPGELAASFDLTRPKRSLGGGLVVERGQAAVLLVAGHAAATLQPGAYTLDTPTLRDLVALGVAGRAAFSFVVTGDVELSFTFENLLTEDHLPVEGQGTLAVRVARPGLFLTSLVRGRARFTESDLCRALTRPVTDGIADFIARVSAFDLQGDLETKRRLAAVLEHHLSETLDAHGLEFVALRTAQFHQEGVWRERQAMGEAILAERSVEVLKRRLAAWQKMAEMTTQLAVVEAQNEQHLAEIRRSLEARRQDQDLIRQQMREKIELEHQLEMARLRLDAGSPGPAESAAVGATITPVHLRRAAQAYARNSHLTPQGAGATHRDLA